MIREQMSKNNKKKFYIIILFLIVILAYHFLLREYTGDFKEMFSQLMDKDTLGDALRKRYETWSSRVFIEAPLILLAHNNAVLLWKVCNIFVWLALALSLMYLTHYKNITMLIGLILMYPVTDMASAGWIATYINYLWPLTAGCISVIALDKMYYDKKIYFPEYSPGDPWKAQYPEYFLCGRNDVCGGGFCISGDRNASSHCDGQPGLPADAGDPADCLYAGTGDQRHF